MTHLITPCNDTKNLNISVLKSNCFKTENNSLNIDANTIIQQIIYITQNAIASLGMITNLIVVAVFLSHKEFRKKIPNIFIINQVSKTSILLFSKLLEEITSSCGRIDTPVWTSG